MNQIKCAAGSLVIYRQKPAKVNSISDGKIDITLPDGDQKSVRLKDITPLHGGPVAQLPQIPLPPPDLMEIVVMMEEETLSMQDFASLVYGRFDPAAAWSAWLLLEEGIYVTGSIADGVKARPEAEITAALEAASAKETGRRQRDELLERIRTGKLLPEDHQHLRDVEHLALGKSAASGVMRQLNMEQTPEKAHRLLLKIGIWDHWKNPFPSRAGILLHDPDLPVPAAADEERLDLTAMTALAIDDAGNQDPDDAISYSEGLLWVHVADVAALVAPGDDVDLEAETRGANLYLPEKTVHMLPPAVTHQLGLGLKEVSPALSFAIRFDDSGAPTLERVTPSLIRATRWSYEEAETRLSEEPLSSLIPLLERFRQFREANGALRIDLPEVKIKVEGKDVIIKPLPSLASREIVAESMMATGAAVGKFAAEKEIPMPFAVQPEPDIVGKPATLAGMFAARRGCTVTSVQTIPGRHSGLGLEPYVRITSPLRRYGDLLAHQQIRLHLAGKSLLPTVELGGKISKSETAAAELRRLERTANEFWKLVYLQLHPDWKGRAVVVDRMDSRLTIMLPDLAYEYKLRYGGNMELNSEWQAAVNVVDLPALTAQFTISASQANKIEIPESS
jgi:exoribonuclease-2